MTNHVMDASERAGEIRFRRTKDSDDGNPQDIGLELHEQFVVDHATIHFQRREGETRVGVYRLQHVAGLKSRGFESGTGEVALVDVAGQADDHPACVTLPVRREQAGEGRDEKDATTVVHGSR